MINNSIQKFKITRVVDIKDSTNSLIPGKYRLYCLPLDTRRTELEALQTFDSINQFGSNAVRPQKEAQFLGVILSDYKVYILKFLDPVTPLRLEQMDTTPQFYQNGATVNDGDGINRVSPMSFTQFLKNGYYKVQASAETFIELIPDLQTFSQLKDKIKMYCKNFYLNVFGGFINWSNFDPDGSGNYVSEFELKAKRGDPTKENNLNNVYIKMGSLTDDKTKILDILVTITDSSNNTSTHEIKIDEAGLHSLSTLKDITVQKDITGSSVTDVVTTKNNTTTITFDDTNFKVETTKDINVKGKDVNVTADNATITGKKVTITGGELDVKGSVTPAETGPFNCLTNCTFTGIGHIGSKVSGT